MSVTLAPVGYLLLDEPIKITIDVSKNAAIVDAI